MKPYGTSQKMYSLKYEKLSKSKIKLILINLFLLINLTAFSSYSLADESGRSDEYSEDLFIRPLPDGKLFTQFQFKTLYRKDIKSLRWENKIETFPLSIVDLVAITDLNKLHFSLTKGNWNYRNWGYPARPSPPGAQIRVQLSQHNENPERSWARLVNSLAGKFCASLASADKQALVASKIAFGHQSIPHNSTEHTLYTNLPEETLCTENLTPWKKLLPCYSKSGLASLLNAVNLLRSSYSSLAIDIEPWPCVSNGQILFGCELVQLTQSINVIFNPLLLFEGKQTWSLERIFGNPIIKLCPAAIHSRVHVDISNAGDKDKLYPQMFDERTLTMKTDLDTSEERHYASFDIKFLMTNSTVSKNDKVNIGLKETKIFKPTRAVSRSNLPVNFKTYVAGKGSGEGTMVAIISNNCDHPVRVTYMNVVPHFLPVYLHTLTVRTKSGQELKPDRLNFVLSHDSKPTLIEFSLDVPAATDTLISYDFERSFLRWTDYKSDANKGFLIGSSIIGVVIDSGLKHLVFPVNSVVSNVSSLIEEENVFRIYARPLLIILPTPDFSMSYNVICFVCTSLAAMFGMIYSLTTKKLRKKVVSKKKKDD